MRKFSSYGPLNPKLHYYAPREALIELALTHLVGDIPAEGGHYITVWGPRQVGKTWLMQQALFRLQTETEYDRFDVVKINLQHLKSQPDIGIVINSIVAKLARALDKTLPQAHTLEDFETTFSRERLDKPLILMLDEFDALASEAIGGLVNVFRNIYIARRDHFHRPTEAQDYLLHGVALIGVQAVLGVENVSGSPFNVQRSLHIPNLTFDEVTEMFAWYERESGQPVESNVVERLFYETQGQPGLTGWFGELLTETYNHVPNQPLTIANLEEVYAAALDLLPNNNILNIISKARQQPYIQVVFDLFKTDEPPRFKYDQPEINYLYLNGVIDVVQTAPTTYEIKFSCPFVQKRLFNYFANDLFPMIDHLYDPFDVLTVTITDDSLTIPNLLGRYETYLQKNRHWLLKDAPRRADLRIYEAVYHFNLYMYLVQFLRRRGGQVYPEFPTGNGKIDLIIHYAGQQYGLELKSFTDSFGYKEALRQAAHYGQQLALSGITVVFFVEAIDETNRSKYEIVYVDQATGVSVRPVFVQTGATD